MLETILKPFKWLYNVIKGIAAFFMRFIETFFILFSIIFFFAFVIYELKEKYTFTKSHWDTVSKYLYIEDIKDGSHRAVEKAKKFIEGLKGSDKESPKKHSSQQKS